MNGYIFFVLFILLYIIYKHNSKNCIEGLNTFVGRMAIDDQYYYDKTFDDVFYYPNLPDGSSTGWEECLKQCPGNCIEYGQTGHSYCFPY